MMMMTMITMMRMDTTANVKSRCGQRKLVCWKPGQATFPLYVQGLHADLALGGSPYLLQLGPELEDLES